MRVTILAGFLGAGKTTLLLRLAEQYAAAGGDRLAIIENEVSAVGVDDEYLDQQGLRVRRIAGGCVCCSLRISLVETLQQIHEVLDPEWVILEASGVADPVDVRQVIGQAGVPVEQCDLLVLIDPERFDDIRRVCGPFFERGIRAADHLLINKLDAIAPAALAELTAKLQALEPTGQLLAVSAREGTGLAELHQRLTASTATAAAEAPALAAGHHHAESGSYLPRETTYAAAWRLSFSPPEEASRLTARLLAFGHWLAGRLAQREGVQVGHVKCLLAGDHGQTWVSLTSTARPAEASGVTSGTVATAELRVNAIVFGLTAEELAALMVEELEPLLIAGGAVESRR